MAECAGALLTYAHTAGRAQSDKTSDDYAIHPARMSTRTDWPQHAFLRWLDQLKDSLGLPSDLQLAQHLGIGHTLISGWRNGRQRPSQATLTTIAGATGDDPRHLWVLAGIAKPAEVGLEGTPVPDPLPREITDLIALYRGADKATRDVLLGQVRFLVDMIGRR